MNRKAKIGLLGLMTEGYEETFPGIMERQSAYGTELAKSMPEDVTVVFEEIGSNRAKIEEIVKEYNRRELDGILIVLLAYSQGAWLLKAMQENRLPVAVAVLQTFDQAEEDFGEFELTINQGIHGAQDNCNVLMRLGVPFQVYAGSRKEAAFQEFVRNFAKAAMTSVELHKLRVATIGRMQGMGDILTDEMKLFEKLGVEICHDSLGCIVKNMREIPASQIQQEVSRDGDRFLIDENLTEESHQEAVREYLAFRKYLEDYGYQAFTAHFDLFGQDGRFRQLPLYAASRLMAEGYGYAAEGDVVCAAMVKAGHLLCDAPANFTEMYMMDKKSDSILFCHAGEGNYATAVPDRKPRLVDRYLGEGGLENPPTILFLPKPGRATLVSMVSVAGGHFRLIAARGEILDKEDLRKCEMPYFFFRPDSGVRSCVESWLTYGGTHHEVICLGDMANRWKMFCAMAGIEYVEV